MIGFNAYAISILGVEVASSGNKNYDLILALLPFLILFLALLFWVKTTHKQSIISLTTVRKKIDFKRMFFSFFLWGLLSLILFVVGYFSDTDSFKWNLNIDLFLKLVLITILLIPFQTSFEEYFFRAYLMQAFGAKFGRLTAILITSIFFGLTHSFNPEVAKLGYGMMVFYIGTGLFLGVITLLDEGIELALGFHCVNNIIGCLLITSDWSALQTDALFIDKSEPNLSLSAFLPVIVCYPLLFYIFSKRYHWSDFKQHLFGRVTPMY